MKTNQQSAIAIGDLVRVLELTPKDGWATIKSGTVVGLTTKGAKVFNQNLDHQDTTWSEWFPFQSKACRIDSGSETESQLPQKEAKTTG